MASQFTLVQCVGNYMTIYMKSKQPIKRIKLNNDVYYPERTCEGCKYEYFKSHYRCSCCVRNKRDNYKPAKVVD